MRCGRFFSTGMLAAPECIHKGFSALLGLLTRMGDAPGLSPTLETLAVVRFWVSMNVAADSKQSSGADQPTPTTNGLLIVVGHDG